MGKTNIGWVKNSWNPYTWHCSKVSAGCANCYMFDMARNLKNYDATGAPSVRLSALKEISRLSGPTFVNSMSDTFHDGVHSGIVALLFALLDTHKQITPLILTKRPERAVRMSRDLVWPRHLWMGVSVESEKYTSRVGDLRLLPAHHKFLSIEPMLGPIELDLTGIDWVIVGGESGNNRRPFEKEWVDPIFEECQRLHIPFFFKQGSARQPGKDRLYRGRVWDEIPKELQYAGKQ